MSAEVIPDESIGRYGRAECPECEWQGPRRIYPGVAIRDADRHNARRHAADVEVGRQGNEVRE